MIMAAEQARLDEHTRGKTNWKQWGCYLSERAWGTVREDYSADGAAWGYFPHDHARSRAYRWNEDGLGGISDDKQVLCFAPALWNGRDPILKERLFGLAGPEGNHGEDVKEAYWYLDNTPTHSYMKMLYRCPHGEFPYADLVAENARRGRADQEYELIDTGIFAEDRFFDVVFEYAKANPDDMLIRITAVNHGHEAAELTMLPTLWFRNTWSWGYQQGAMADTPSKPHLRENFRDQRTAILTAYHAALGDMYLYAEGAPEFVFTENETNNKRLFGAGNASPYVKDAFHRYVVNGEIGAVNPNREGTKAAAIYKRTLEAGETWVIRLRLSRGAHGKAFERFDEVFEQRQREADDFYDAIHAAGLNADQRAIQRQALAGMLWSKQLYYYDIEQWLAGDPGTPPPEARAHGRNSEWRHLNNFDILSMPDVWEYPWYAAWDTAFHCLPLALVDIAFAKNQLSIMTREWYMHPNGQLPAYEWGFGDVNPPVHAWAAMRVYQIERDKRGRGDVDFLRRIFHKMLFNFSWWVNRKDNEGKNIFQGGFLGLDNISVFDRSARLPDGSVVNQSDGTAWMGFYCLTMLNIALELAKHDRAYEEMAIKFYEHFLSIAVAMSGFAHHGIGLFDEADDFFYDVLQMADGRAMPLKVRSLVGLIPLLAVETVGHDTLEMLPEFARSIAWMQRHRPHLTGNLAETNVQGYGNAYLYAIPTRERLIAVLRRMLDEGEFLSAYGVRSLSKAHEQQPYTLDVGETPFTVGYEPAESQSGIYGGNSNWRGPIWFPINYLIIEALRKYHRYYGDALRIEYPTGSGEMCTLREIADALARRLCGIFERGADGRRAVFGGSVVYQDDPLWRDYILFYEYFHGDDGAGLGASHQTGWTGLVAVLLDEINEEQRKNKT